MKMRTVGGALVAVALGFAATPGFAAPVGINFIWDPSQVSPSLPGSNGQVNAYNMILSNYASINVNRTTGGFTEHAYEVVTAFQNSSGTNITVPGFAGGTATGHYNLVFDLTADGSQTPNPGNPNNFSGSFSHVSYSLYAVPEPNSVTPIFTAIGGVDHQAFLDLSSDPVLASGGLVNGYTNYVSLTVSGGYNPTAGATVTMTPNANPDESGFFVKPSDYSLVLLTGNFSTTGVPVYDVSPTLQILNIGGGSGNANFSFVPEPASLAILGGALVFLGMAIRRRPAA